ncbi:MAG TPA: P-loop NTPase [Candidatus Aminicenantes bacterium]|nr:P-loop NTPase [Candidatus Aminicenantes bacterium]HRY66087.1 P-loop NTPase [Candidatus Aminicenantes bacterium]HRZ72864.1 P-loop NTPase [Candidatus Aminicenantes bacterium]
MDKRIWAIGGGKGGTGKSFIAANLGLHLASLDRQVVLLDADLGAPNLHTLLGMKAGHPDLGDFLTGVAPSLEEAAVATPYKNLRLVRGSENILFIANLPHFRKLRLLRQIRQLETPNVILDLGTGSSYNTLDFFLSANPGVVVATPEPTAIENTYLFLKSCIMRVLKLYMDHYKIRDLHQRMLDQIEKNSQSLYGFFKSLMETDRSYGTILYRALRGFRPCLVMNKTRDERDVLLGRSVADVARKYLLIDMKYLGAVPYADDVQASLRGLRPYYPDHRDAAAARAIRQMSEEMAYSIEFTLRTPPEIRLPEA